MDNYKDFFAPLTERTDSLIDRNRVSFIAIDGRCTSGKSTLSSYLEAVYGDLVTVIHMDDFFLPPHLREQRRFEKPGMGVHIERIETEIVRPILFGERELIYGKFDCSLGRVTGNIKQRLAPLTVIEGVYSMRPELRPLYSLSVFLDVSKNEQIERLKRRSPEKLSLFKEQFIPREEKYFSHLNIKNACDLYFITG